MRLVFHRSEFGYGWSVTVFIRGKHRVRWNSTKATTRMWPRFIYGSDEDCNRATSLVMWPLGCLDVWWGPKWRAEGSGLCDDCLAEFAAATPSTAAIDCRVAGCRWGDHTSQQCECAP